MSKRTAAERFWSKVEIGDGPDACFRWTGALRDGYGRFGVDGRTVSAHRFSFEDVVGRIPPGLVLDHFVCENPGCVRPSHLRPVSQRENLLRSEGVSAKNAGRTHCPRGHELGGENVQPSRKAAGKRSCRTCQRERRRERYAIARAAAGTKRRLEERSELLHADPWKTTH